MPSPADPPAGPPSAAVVPPSAVVIPPPRADAVADAVAAAGLGIYDFDLVTGAVRWSAAALAIYGGFEGDADAVDVVRLRARVHPLDWPKLFAARQIAEAHARRHAAGADAGGDPDGADGGEHRGADGRPRPVRVDVPHRVVRPDGSVRRVRATGEYHFGPDGAAWRSVGVLRDETDVLAAAEAAAEAADRARRALAAAGLGTFDHDARTGLTVWDGPAKHLFGLPEDAPDERPMAEIVARFHHEDRDAVRASVARALDPAADGRFEQTHRVVRPDGAVRHVRARATVEFAVTPAGRRPVRTVGVLEDVTDRPR